MFDLASEHARVEEYSLFPFTELEVYISVDNILVVVVDLFGELFPVGSLDEGVSLITDLLHFCANITACGECRVV